MVAAPVHPALGPWVSTDSGLRSNEGRIAAVAQTRETEGRPLQKALRETSSSSGRTITFAAVPAKVRAMVSAHPR